MDWTWNFDGTWLGSEKNIESILFNIKYLCTYIRIYFVTYNVECNSQRSSSKS